MKAATTLELGAVRRKITGLEAKHEADMHIRELTLENFRGAQHLPLDLDKRLNVFVGMNGAGKSSGSGCGGDASFMAGESHQDIAAHQDGPLQGIRHQKRTNRSGNLEY
jgi:predicted ATPase